MRGYVDYLVHKCSTLQELNIYIFLVQSFVAVPITTELLNEVQPTAETNAEDHVKCATSLSHGTNF